jgi:hypothetical protein
VDTTSLEKSQMMIARLIERAAENGIKETSLSFGQLNLDESYVKYFRPCFDWLEAEGVTRAKSYHETLAGATSGSIQNLVLTSLGQSLLGMEISIDGKPQLLAETVEKVSSGDTAYSKFGDFLGGAIGGLIKSLGTG